MVCGKPGYEVVESATFELILGRVNFRQGEGVLSDAYLRSISTSDFGPQPQTWSAFADLDPY